MDADEEENEAEEQVIELQHAFMAFTSTKPTEVDTDSATESTLGVNDSNVSSSCADVVIVEDWTKEDDESPVDSSVSLNLPILNNNATNEQLWKHIFRPWFVDSGCSWHMTGDISQLSDIQIFNGGFVSFAGREKGKITQKGTVSNGVLKFENVNYVPELKHSLLNVSQICDKGFSTHFTNKECLILKPGIVIPEEWILVGSQRKDNTYLIDIDKNIPEEITCLFSKASEHNSMLLHRRLGHENVKNLNRLVKNNIVRGLPVKDFVTIEKCVACALGKHHRKSHKQKPINSISIVFQLLHMELFGPVHVLSLSCSNHRLVITDDYSRFTWVLFLSNKGHKTTVVHFRAFGCPCTLLNVESTQKFKAKADDCYFVGYDSRTAYSVYNKVSKQIVKWYDVRWFKENETDARVGPDWLFDYDKLFQPVNLFSVTDSATVIDDEEDSSFDIQKSPMLKVEPSKSSEMTQPSSENLEENTIDTMSPHELSSKETLPVEGESAIQQIFGSTLFPDVISNEYIASTSYSHRTTASGWRNPLTEVLEEPTNMPANRSVPDHSVPSRIQWDHPIENIIGPIEASVSTRSQTGTINNCLYSCFISQIEPKSIDMALQEPSWVRQSSIGILLHQGMCVEDMLTKFEFQDSKSAVTPMAERPLLSSDLDGKHVDQTYYRSMIGSLIYLKGQPKLGLWYPKTSEIELYAFSDNNYGDDDIDRKSTSDELSNFSDLATDPDGVKKAKVLLSLDPFDRTFKAVAEEVNKSYEKTASFPEIMSSKLE
ncbi:uncharacterized protein LOC143532205 [Bidens hawaiensis]|uniref:uncharacterized protein LOC143532205 n=1 Tax=Bidens hawaiensis TaxID=980011 RepID=UPI00404AA39A